MHLIESGAPVLVLCAHPDDEVGCGGFVNLLVEQGHPIHYVYFSDCAESTAALGFPPEQLISECIDSCETLGIAPSNIRGYKFPVRRLPEVRQEILETLVQLRKEISPRLVMAASRNDIHQDHAALTQEALRAFKHANVIGYEFPWNHIVSHLDLLVRLEDRHVKAKVRAWECYKTQQSRAYHGPSIIESLARVRGVQANTEFAESYQVLRLVI